MTIQEAFESMKEGLKVTHLDLPEKSDCLLMVFGTNIIDNNARDFNEWFDKAILQHNLKTDWQYFDDIF